MDAGKSASTQGKTTSAVQTWTADDLQILISSFAKLDVGYKRTFTLAGARKLLDVILRQYPHFRPKATGKTVYTKLADIALQLLRGRLGLRARTIVEDYQAATHFRVFFAHTKWYQAEQIKLQRCKRKRPLQEVTAGEEDDDHLPSAKMPMNHNTLRGKGENMGVMNILDTMKQLKAANLSATADTYYNSLKHPVVPQQTNYTENILSMLQTHIANLNYSISYLHGLADGQLDPLETGSTALKL
jgi:hypothetical protein